MDPERLFVASGMERGGVPSGVPSGMERVEKTSEGSKKRPREQKHFSLLEAEKIKNKAKNVCSPNLAREKFRTKKFSDQKPPKNKKISYKNPHCKKILAEIF